MCFKLFNVHKVCPCLPCEAHKLSYIYTCTSTIYHTSVHEQTFVSVTPPIYYFLYIYFVVGVRRREQEVGRFIVDCGVSVGHWDDRVAFKTGGFSASVKRNNTHPHTHFREENLGILFIETHVYIYREREKQIKTGWNGLGVHGMKFSKGWPSSDVPTASTWSDDLPTILTCWPHVTSANHVPVIALFHFCPLED